MTYPTTNCLRPDSLPSRVQAPHAISSSPLLPMDLRTIFSPLPHASRSIPFFSTRLRPLHRRGGSSSLSAPISRFLRLGTAAAIPARLGVSLVGRCHADGSVLGEIDAVALRAGDEGYGNGGFSDGVKCAEHSVQVLPSLEVGASPLPGSESESPSIWKQVQEIVVFAGPATGLWICGPLMSLIDTAVIGQSSSLELAALGPGTVFCDYFCYVFMFLSIATSNMVATALAKKDKILAQHQMSMLLFVALSCGVGMFLFTKFVGTSILTGFIGLENMHIVPVARTYVQIRGYAWPPVLVGMVAQSASLGMKNSWGPLKALVVASVINGLGDIILCSVFGFGIAGAAWATVVSQVVAALMMIQTLNKTGFNPFSITVPSGAELLQIVELAAPVFLTMTSKVAFYSLLTYFATSMGTVTVAAHQVMINVYCMCTVWGEPLSQTAQSFMPEMLHGVNRNLSKARLLLKSLVIIGALTGLVLGAVGTSVPWIFPNIFTSDGIVIREMHKVLIPYFIALTVTPSTHSLEGTLLAGRDLRFLSLSMIGCLSFGGLLLLEEKSKSSVEKSKSSVRVIDLQ